MSLTHHSNVAYDLAAGQAAEAARSKMGKILAAGRMKAASTVESIAAEYSVRKDILVPSQALAYEVIDGEVVTRVDEAPVDFTNHAYTQLLGRIGLPKTFADKLSDVEDSWGPELLAHNMRKLTDSVLEKDKLLFRMVGNTTKGVLSSAYRRMDASPIFETFLKEGLSNGLVPVDGVNSDTRYHIKMLKDRIYEPAPNEVVCFGMGLTTSDYGAGALQLQLFVMRLWCTNFMIGENCLKKIHIGQRFSGDEGSTETIALSQKTYELDTATVASAVKDIVTTGIDTKADEICALIASANEKDINVKAAIESYRKRGLMTKEDGQKAETLFDTVTELDYLPQAKSAWRFSNVLSLMAQSVDGDKKLALENMAMDVIR